MFDDEKIIEFTARPEGFEAFFNVALPALKNHHMIMLNNILLSIGLGEWSISIYCEEIKLTLNLLIEKKDRLDFIKAFKGYLLKKEFYEQLVKLKEIEDREKRKV